MQQVIIDKENIFIPLKVLKGTIFEHVNRITVEKNRKGILIKPKKNKAKLLLEFQELVKFNEQHSKSKITLKEACELPNEMNI